MSFLSRLLTGSVSRPLKDLFELPGLARGTIFDIGANRGDFLRTCQASGFVGTAIAVEPDPVLASQLKNKNSYSAVIDCAVGIENGECFLNRYSRRELNSFAKLTPEAFQEFGVSELDGILVPTWRLDSLIASCDHVFDSTNPLLIKLDTQGFDSEIIASVPTEFWHGVTVIQTEVAIQSIYQLPQAWSEQLTQLDTLGFDLWHLEPVSRDRRGQLIELDVIAVQRTARFSSD